jgi:hypothetical protein
MQGVFGVFLQLKPLTDPEPFDPEYLAPAACSDHQFMTHRTRNFRIYEQILQFDGRTHANRLEPVARPPVPKSHRRADFAGVE